MKKYSRVIAVFSLILLSCSSYVQNNDNTLLKGFVTPPNAAKPRVWWHWMSGNVTREGIRADLEWMHRVGIGGFQNFDAGLATPQIVGKRLVYMTPAWKDAFLFTTKLADSLGLEMAIAGSPGWSESGGPWVTPAQAMKKYVWSETRIEGGKPFAGILPKPPTTTGTFQNIAIKRSENAAPIPEYYADAAVVAYRVPENDISMEELKPKVTSSGGKFNLTALTDDDLEKTTFLPAAQPNGKSWIQFEFTKPEKIQSVTIVLGDQESSSNPALEASDDGLRFKTVLQVPGGGTSQKTITFPPVTARFFRLIFTTPAPVPSGSRGQRAGASSGTQVAEFDLHSVALVNRFEDKAGFSPTRMNSMATPDGNLYSLATPPVSASEAINKDDVVDLTSKMQPDGTLNWTPPAGHWMVTRLGYSLTGKTNHPASPEATGLEVDKLSAEHCKAYFENYLDQYKDATGGLMGKKGLQYMITDSWEAGTLNWTDKMMTGFKNRRGYDMLPWLPVLTGHIVESAEASDRFLWDFRKTIADLTAENHYDQLTTLLHERGMGRYSESHENCRHMVADGMEVKRTADIPMSATWTPGNVGGNATGEVAVHYKADVRESASVAHIYGQNLVAAESLTAIGTPWAWAPESLKPTADMELACGLNRFVIHCSVHQPVFDKIPGLGLGPFGQWFTRNETWAEQAGAWTTYLARSS
ncbi:MAG: discoidin domain-containing protein, partial [Bacteroidetes bacterium]|nr:discoidin domain-containing protein [Bacteroidota bacterium]